MTPLPSASSSDDLESRLFLAEAGAELPEADLHGLRWDQAREQAERLIQGAYVHRERVVRIIHGKGEGKLRDALHGWLRAHPLVEGFRESAVGGETAVALRN